MIVDMEQKTICQLCAGVEVVTLFNDKDEALFIPDL